MPSQRVTFSNANGDRLAGILDQPQDTPAATAVFAHCFTCTKDLKAIVKISRQLAKQSIAVLRFDFTGLGNSSGDFSSTNVETNISDLKAAIEWMTQNHQAPKLLIGHSLGGAAVMAVAGDYEHVAAIATLASPSDTHHLARFLASQNQEIQETGAGNVSIGGRDHLITTQLLESLNNFDLRTRVESIRLPHLILHSPTDKTVDYQHAKNLFEWGQGPSTLLTLPGSDHLLLNHAADASWVADCIAAWSDRFTRQ